ncbi:hypothetical protein, partial [Klebsiella pneumoniae]|uniref:hypothetical protein n=1 Tax=Klebsiella pneumoniae TaxID=573 RepID=UPI002183ED2A
GLTALSAEFTIGEGELMAHDVPLGCAPDEYDDLISGTCSHLPYGKAGHAAGSRPITITNSIRSNHATDDSVQSGE